MPHRPRQSRTRRPSATGDKASLTLADAVQAWGQHLALHIQRLVARHCKNLQRCDQCGAEAKLVDDVCGVCGASSPVRVPHVVPVAIGASALAILLLVWCCS